MNAHYEEIVDGESLLRYAPGARHELVCQRLHEAVAASLAQITIARLLPPRTVIQLAPGTLVRPDLTLVTTANGRPWLVAEVVEKDDHRADTVTKKSLYEDLKIPRLWMIDPRYHNLEVYHGSPHGLALKQIMAGREILTEALLPALALKVTDLFERLPE